MRVKGELYQSVRRLSSWGSLPALQWHKARMDASQPAESTVNSCDDQHVLQKRSVLTHLQECLCRCSLAESRVLSDELAPSACSKSWACILPVSPVSDGSHSLAEAVHLGRLQLFKGLGMLSLLRLDCSCHSL